MCSALCLVEENLSSPALASLYRGCLFHLLLSAERDTHLMAGPTVGDWLAVVADPQPTATGWRSSCHSEIAVRALVHRPRTRFKNTAVCTQYLEYL